MDTHLTHITWHKLAKKAVPTTIDCVGVYASSSLLRSLLALRRGLLEPFRELLKNLHGRGWGSPNSHRAKRGPKLLQTFYPKNQHL